MRLADESKFTTCQMITVPLDFHRNQHAQSHSQLKQVGAPNVPWAVISGCNEFEDFCCHRGVSVAYCHSVSHIFRFLIGILSRFFAFFLEDNNKLSKYCQKNNQKVANNCKKKVVKKWQKRAKSCQKGVKKGVKKLSKSCH
jgi:hypothetical protein